MIKIGLIREGKNPPDKRVALTPEQCVLVEKKYPQVKIIVQPSAHRIFADEKYTEVGITLQEDLNECDILLGVKEVPIADLLPGKTYLFFSHTIKKQPYNRKLLQEILKKQIRLIDYEVIVDQEQRRLIGFGKYAGIAGTYSGFRALGHKLGIYQLTPGYLLSGKEEMIEKLNEIALPPQLKIILTGDGRVAKGALEILNSLPLKKVGPDEFLQQSFTEPVFVHLCAKDFYLPKEAEKSWNRNDFYNNPENYRSDFSKFTHQADFFIAGHFWNPKSAVFFTNEEMQDPKFQIKVIADISCDIDGPIPSTVRGSSIAEPFYGYDPLTAKETDFYDPKAVGVMAVDNLPCEIPADASAGFGQELIKNVIPYLINQDEHGYIKNGTITEDGKLTERFRYLEDYVAG